MAFELNDCEFLGPALPEPFVKFDLENELKKAGILKKDTGDEGKELQRTWDTYRRHLRSLVSNAGAIRVRNNVLEPLIPLLGYKEIKNTGTVLTREGNEDGGYLMANGAGTPTLRIWAKDLDIDLDAPAKRGAAYRYSYLRIAQRVLLASGERLGLLTNGTELRLLISDPARPDSQVIIPLDPDWKRTREVPDSFRMLLGLCSPQGISILPEIVDKARFKQAEVTKELRQQAKQAVIGFMQGVLDHPDNQGKLSSYKDRNELARVLWHEGLIIVYRLLFVLKGESNDDPARNFGFASTSLWRNTYSPSVALAGYVRAILDKGAETGSYLENGMRSLFRMFGEGLHCSELNIEPLGGALFGSDTTPLLSSLKWGELSVAHLLDKLLWTIQRKKKGESRERVHYGPLDVEDLGRVYEALLELDPGISTETMCRLRRSKLEVVVPVAQGEKYKKAPVVKGTKKEKSDDDDSVEFVEEIPKGKFYLRVGLGRKTTGSYYTPHSFVRFLVQETCGPLVDERSPKDDPNPLEILKLKVLDPAMGSGHFLVEACRFLGEKLYEASRLCDEKTTLAEKSIVMLESKLAELKEGKKSQSEIAEVEKKILQATEDKEKFWKRVVDLPDPDDEILSYLPSRAPEGEERGLSEKKAMALCRRLVSVHCLYGVDKNPLAVELAKLSLWLESHAEGLPLTYLDHRLIVGDSLTGPFWEHLLKYPGSQQPLDPDDLWKEDVNKKFTETLSNALLFVDKLQSTVGSTLSELEDKKRLKAELDRSLAPFKVLAAAWTGGVMLGKDKCDDTAYAKLVKYVGANGDLPEKIVEDYDPEDEQPIILQMIARGLGLDSIPNGKNDIYALFDFKPSVMERSCIPSVAYDLTFPEVFFPDCQLNDKSTHGYDVLLGNPPWDRMLPSDKEFFAGFDFEVLNASNKSERASIQARLISDKSVDVQYQKYISGFRESENAVDELYKYQIVEIDGESTIGKQDLYRLFCERVVQLLKIDGYSGFVIPSAFHANEGATGIRRLYLNEMSINHCYSFENKKKLFEIHSSFKFACVVAKKDSKGTNEFKCAFYLQDDEWLFLTGNKDDLLNYSKAFVEATGGDYLSLLEIRFNIYYKIAEKCFVGTTKFSDVCESYGVKLGREMNTTDDAWRFVSTRKVFAGGEDPRNPDIAIQTLKKGYLIVHEGKTFWHFDDRWEDPPKFLIKLDSVSEKPKWKYNSRYYRLSYRLVASSTNERTVIFAFIPPGALFTNAAPTEQSFERFNSSALTIMAIANSFTFDWCARLMVGANLNWFILSRLPVPEFKAFERFLCHSSLRLISNHDGYAKLWNEQLKDNWKEKSKNHMSWPVLQSDQERWTVRSAIDALLANAYGLGRDEYKIVLQSFDMPSAGPNPYTGICLEKFDELKKFGVDAFTKKYDPYWDIPINEDLPKPVIDIPGMDENDYKLTGKKGNRQSSLGFDD